MFCGYHGWHDWYLSANLAEDSALDGHLLSGLDPAGVPRALRNYSFPFSYNDTEGFIKTFEANKDDVGVIVLESIRNINPDKAFLETIQRIAQKNHVPIIIDEITAGFRINPGGAHLQYGFVPDIAVFAKSISNGYPMAAVIGKKKIMEAAQVSFISSTYWTDRIGPTAAIATIQKMISHKVQDFVVEKGKKVQEGWKKLSDKHNLNLHIGSLYPLSHFDFSEKPLVHKTLFTQLMLEKNYLASTSFYLSYAHTDEVVENYLSACDGAFSEIKKAIDSGNSEKMLKGPVCHSGFKRLN